MATYRDTLLKNSAKLQSHLRDLNISHTGMRVEIRIPLPTEQDYIDFSDNQELASLLDTGTKFENFTDTYQDFIDSGIKYVSVTTTVIPNWNSYHNLVAAEGQSMESDLSLEVSIPSGLYIPKNSLLIMNEVDAFNRDNVREWRVIASSVKQLNHIYTKILSVVPSRELYQSITLHVPPINLNAGIIVGDPLISTENSQSIGIALTSSLVANPTVENVIETDPIEINMGSNVVFHSILGLSVPRVRY